MIAERKDARRGEWCRGLVAALAYNPAASGYGLD